VLMLTWAVWATDVVQAQPQGQWENNPADASIDNTNSGNVGINATNAAAKRHAQDTSASLFASPRRVATLLLQSRPGIAFRASATSANEARAKTMTVDKPGGTAANDVMLATVFVRGAAGGSRITSTVTPPAGWTLIRRDDHTNDSVPGGISSMLSYYRVAAASEPASHTWTFDTSRLAVASIASYSGVSTSSPVETHGGQASLPDAFATTITAPSITTTVSNAVVVGLFGLHEGAHSITPAAGMIERFERTSPEAVTGPRPVASNLTLEMADELRATPGATGKREATATFADTWVAHVIALKPASKAAR